LRTGLRQYDHAVHRPLTLLAAVLLASCAACSDTGSGDGDGSGGDTGLRDALGRVAATDSTRQYVEYGDVALLSKLADGPDGRRFLGVSGYGFSRLATTSTIIADKLRFDATAMDGAVVAGQPPDTTGLLWGDYDVAAVEQKLADLGIPSEDDDGGKRWTSAKDHEIAFDGPLAGIARTSELNVIRTADGTFAYAPARAGVDAVTEPGGDTLGDDPVLLRLSGCLGDVAAALLVAPTGDDPTAYGVGIRATEDGEITEVACLSPDGDPKAVRDHVERELENGTTPSTRQPWDELLPDATVDVVEYGAVVRLVAKPAAGAPAGRVFNMLQTRDLAALAGS
jgi:hypothetical protein